MDVVEKAPNHTDKHTRHLSYLLCGYGEGT